MKIWKKSLFFVFIALSFFGAIAFYYCEKYPCTDQNCLHGGSCGNGLCTCPTGWDGAYCEYRTVQRFLGVYAGSEYCNNGGTSVPGAPVIDSVFVLPDTFKSPLSVMVVLETNKYDTLYGVASYSSTSSTISIPVEYRTNFYDIYTLTLQPGGSLKFNSYSDNKTDSNAEVIENCTFQGFWTSPN